MTIIVPLTPHLEQFVREQLANGRFQTEGDIICAALRLLEDQPPVSSAGLPRIDAAPSLPTNPSESRRAASWQELREHLSNRVTGPDVASTRRGRRSPRGILADLRSNVSLDDFEEARHEVWASLPRSTA
jgi:Arc/MetJ-type ribon-helix-helix transcriptional regulator